MNDDRTLERAARSWLEAGPTEAPDLAVDAALRSIQTTHQERDLRVSWRVRKMSTPARLAAAAIAIAVVTVGGAALILRPGENVAVGGPSPSPTSPSTPAPSVAPAPSASPVLDPARLTGQFTSPLYGYTIRTDPRWTIKNATVPINDPRSTDATAYDQIVISGTDTRVGVAADPIGNQSFEQYLAGQHATVLQGTNSADCKGSDPSTWANVTVGDREGRVMVLCNFEVVFVQVGDRVFQFTWGHDTFTPARHLPLSGFQELLTTVVFGPPPNPAASATR